MAETAIAKKFQPSRKGKKAWRKNIDMAPVEESLETVRVEERVRGKVADANELFTLDTAGDATVRRQVAKDRPLRVDEILNQRSAVPAVANRVRHAATEKTISRYTKQQIGKIAKRKQQDDSSPLPKKKNKRLAAAAYDVWGDEPTQEATEENSYLDVVKERKVNAPSTLKRKPTAAIHQPAIALPHAGTSYNPTMEDHQALLQKAHEIEIRKEEEAQKLQEKLSYRKELEDLAHELEQTIEDDENESTHESDNEQADPAQKKESKRKTRAQRNKERRVKLEQLAHKRKQHEKEIRKQIDMVNQIEEEVKQHQEKLEHAAEKRQEARDYAEKEGARRLGKHYVKERPIDVQLQDELSETLRQLKPEGNLLHDRQHSLHKRNIIEPRVPIKRQQKYKPKVYEKRAYKQFDAKQSK